MCIRDRSLFLNIKLKEDTTWTRVYKESAEPWVQQLRKEEANNLSQRLSRSSQSAFASRNRPSQLTEAMEGVSSGGNGNLAAGVSAFTSKNKVSTWNGSSAAAASE